MQNRYPFSFLWLNRWTYTSLDIRRICVHRSILNVVFSQIIHINDEGSIGRHGGVKVRGNKASVHSSRLVTRDSSLLNTVTAWFRSFSVTLREGENKTVLSGLSVYNSTAVVSNLLSGRVGVPEFYSVLYLQSITLNL